MSIKTLNFKCTIHHKIFKFYCYFIFTFVKISYVTKIFCVSFNKNKYIFNNNAL